MSKGKKKNDIKKPTNFSLSEIVDNGIDFENRIIRINGPIGTAPLMSNEEYYDFNWLDFALTKMESESGKDITIRINSQGGDVYEALAMVGRIKASTASIITEAYGNCMSAATLLLLSGDWIRISEYCTPMFHEMAYGTPNQKHTDNKEYVEQAEVEQEKIIAFYADHSNKTKSFWRRSMEHKMDFYPSPDQLLSWEVVDEVI